ncbi:hypothetical protein Tco_0821672 [Tanacetum coccineum]|uniref:Uncharacterized protein n=1 Tax=Tanacetum coccineum TaxID=301880 RepID=A0ABQ5ADW1_9ASTR
MALAKICFLLMHSISQKFQADTRVYANEPNGSEDKSVAMDSNSNLESRSSVTISLRSCVLQACTTTSSFIALAGVVIRQNSTCLGRANRILSIKEDTTRIMKKLILNKCMEKAQAESSLAKPNTDDDMNIELNKEFLMELRSNAYHGTFDEDVVDHIPKVLEMLDLIKIPNVDTHRLRMKVFPLSLQWWIDEWDGKITTWKELLRNFSVNSIPYPALAKMKCWRKVIVGD